MSTHNRCFRREIQCKKNINTLVEKSALSRAIGPGFTARDRI